MRSSAVTAVTPSQPEIRVWRPRSHHAAQTTAAPYEARLARWVRITPAGFVAQAIDARNTPASASPLASAAMFTLFVMTVAAACAITTGLTRLLLASAELTGTGNGRRFTARLLPARAYAPDSKTGAAIREVATVAAAEWRALLRAPALHLPLRGPAMLLFILFFTLFAADMGPDALLNLQDFVGIGSILYAFLWQVQLLCNRFGNEAGTAELLFGMPTSRRRLMIGRNLALGALLLIGDYVAVLLLATSAGAAPYVMSALLLSLPVSLVITTAVGNLLSVLAPFPIRDREGAQPPEPPRQLAVAYAIVAAVNAAVLFGLSHAPPVLRLPAAIAILSALYAGSLWGAERLLYRREPLLIARLNAGGGSAE